jgi:hypothetical protein
VLTTTQDALRTKTIEWAAEIKAWNLAWETGIYPGEMAAFLAMCDLAGVASIVESGRGLHAYSTHVLGEYADRTGTRVVSIDMESDPIKGPECRRRLEKYTRVTCVTGDAYEQFARVLALLPGPIALLLDGPKAFGANRLSLVATILFPITVVAHHNSDPGMPWTIQFARLFPGAFHYEELRGEEVPGWAPFKTWEREAVKGYELPGKPGRSLSRSSLVLASVPPGPRPRSMVRGLGAARDQIAGFWLMSRWQRQRARMMREE